MNTATPHNGIRKRRVFFLAFLAFLLTPLVLPVLAGAQKKTEARTPARPKSEAKAADARKVRIVPQIPHARRDVKNRVILERADRLTRQENEAYMVVAGKVKFSKGPMLMYCDSAHYYPDEGSMDAFGNVKMEQGDTLFVYADELNYSGPMDIAYLYGYEKTRPVRLINRDVKLETDVFTYDLFNEYGYYTTNGILTDAKNRLVSVEGEYIPSTKEANFYTNVHLTSLSEEDTLDIYTDTLFYNTTTHLAEFYSPTEIINAQGTINSTQGNYNTNADVAEFFAHSLVRTNRGTTLEGDTLFYDRKSGIGEAFGNMALVDSVRQSTLRGDYGYYDENLDSAYVTGHAEALEYSRGDTLFMHGRQITSVVRVNDVCVDPGNDSVPPTYAPDSTHIISAWPRVRFYRIDMQGVCDSMSFVERDSMLYMHYHPVVWSDNQQVFGNMIMVHLNDSTVDRAILPDFAFTAQKLEEDIYNQLTGKKMTAYFEGGHMRRVELDGSVEAIFFPEENDSTINKMVYVQSSYLTAWMKENAIERMKMWPESTGKATPLYLARRSMLLLSKFEWFEELRPLDPADIFYIPPEMDAIMANAVKGEIPVDEKEKALKAFSASQASQKPPQPKPMTDPAPETPDEAEAEIASEAEENTESASGDMPENDPTSEPVATPDEPENPEMTENPE